MNSADYNTHCIIKKRNLFTEDLIMVANILLYQIVM